MSHIQDIHSAGPGWLMRGRVEQADTLVKPTLTVMSRNIQDYAHDHHRPNRNDPECLLFYALCQALFYTLCFRLPELLEMDRGAMFISSLRLDTIVGCSLCPLQVCQKDVAMQFSRITRQHDVVYCNQYLRRSRSVLSRRIDTFQMQYTDGDAPAHQVEDFFPFDPYELKTSGEYIRPQYRTWTVRGAHPPLLSIEYNGLSPCMCCYQCPARITPRYHRAQPPSIAAS
eukprot:m.282766 g.282766  ORF g.282766 m.282766 type:complete len:228 (+) comp19866_c0_seq1:1981-2664(+)